MSKKSNQNRQRRVTQALAEREAYRKGFLAGVAHTSPPVDHMKQSLEKDLDRAVSLMHQAVIAGSLNEKLCGVYVQFIDRQQSRNLLMMVR